MRKFRVVKCPQTRILKYIKHGKRDDGSVYAYPVFKEIKAGEKDLAGNVWYPGAYGVEGIKEGDVIELDGELARKAASNPALEEVKPGRPKKQDAA